MSGTSALSGTSAAGIGIIVAVIVIGMVTMLVLVFLASKRSDK
ncbi:MAG TPA: hypothetical protein VG253_01320 [Streptosporangiaceae bacterium]|jgi:hypothetical protein|nr:hypothetical protein [Streptosporangiaceae bacterium]